MFSTILKFFASRSLFTKLFFLSTILFIVAVSIVFYSLSLGLSVNVDNFIANSNTISADLGAVATFWLLFLLLLGVLYVLIGLSRLVYEKVKNVKKPKIWNVRSMIVKGVLVIVFSLVLFFVLSLALSFFGLSMGNCMCLPKLPPPDSQNSDTGFPVEDLKVVGVTQSMLSPTPSTSPNPSLSPNPSGDNSGLNCVITLKNTSNNLTATNASLEYYDKGQPDEEQEVEDDYFTNTDHILPGQTYQVQVEVLQNDCNITKSVKILSAGIAKNP